MIRIVVDTDINFDLVRGWLPFFAAIKIVHISALYSQPKTVAEKTFDGDICNYKSPEEFGLAKGYPDISIH
jgi:hypothetical protein